MKGPLIFLAALAAAAAFAVLVLLPAVVERDDLRTLVRARPGSDGPPPASFVAARERLRLAIGSPVDRPPGERARKIVADHTVGSPATDGPDGIAFTTRWDHVSRLLAELEEVAGILENFAVEAGDVPDQCRVRILLRESDR